ncbi:MAG: RDD family protein [Chitinophagaceae bacterium]
MDTLRADFLLHNKLSIGARLSAMFLDHIIMCAIAMPFFLLGIGGMFSTLFDAHAQELDVNTFNIYVSIIGLSLYFSKDCFQGRSLAKRALKQQVVDNATGEPASPMKCFIRNIFILIWPVEVIVTFGSPQRRIGDRIAGTKVMPYVRPQEKHDINYLQIVVSLVLSYSLLILLLVLFKWTPEKTTPAFSKSSYNATLSAELSRMYTDSLSEYLSADARVYDSSAIPGRKYVSLAIKLKANYLEDREDIRLLDSMIYSMLQTRLPEGTYTGKLKYTYRREGNYQTSTRNLR